MGYEIRKCQSRGELAMWLAEALPDGWTLREEVWCLLEQLKAEPAQRPTELEFQLGEACVQYGDRVFSLMRTMRH